MLFSELVTQIKTEARVKTDDNFDDVVVSLLNELFKEAVEAQRPFEMKVEVAIPVTITTGISDLPDDFFVPYKVFFQDADTGRQYQLADEDSNNEPAPRGLYGHPISYEILTDNKIIVKPPDALVTDDHLFIVYHKTPPIVGVATMDTTQNPLSRLEPFLCRAAIRRIRMLHIDDPQVAQMFASDVASAASSYARAEPPEDDI